MLERASEDAAGVDFAACVGGKRNRAVISHDVDMVWGDRSRRSRPVAGEYDVRLVDGAVVPEEGSGAEFDGIALQSDDAFQQEVTCSAVAQCDDIAVCRRLVPVIPSSA